MLKLFYFTVLYLALVYGEREEVTPQVPGSTRRNYAIPRTDIYQPNFNVHRYRDTRSPAVEVLMHLPEPFRDVDSFKKYLGIKPERIKRYSDDKLKRRSKTKRSVKSYEFSQIAPTESTGRRKEKRETEIPDSQTVESRSLKIQNDPTLEPEKFIPTSMVEGGYRDKLTDPYPETIIEMPAPIRGPVYTTYNGNMDMEDIFEIDDTRKRTGRTTSANDHEDNSQRDKRTYMENGENRESTTAPPFWKRKKENPPFVTGREQKGRDGKGNNNNYTPPQHRSGDNARESHSMKDLDKSVQSNEIPRSPQDSYYASTNRRTYNSRQAENFTPSTPKSVYDTIDYSNRGRSQEGRAQFGRNFDNREPSERPRTYEQLAKQYAYPRVYDRYYYPYPYPGEVLGRGIEYYHRTYDPSTGRIIYYANMPDHGRSYDPNVRPVDPTGRSFYMNGRTYVYDPYGRSYVLPYDYRYVDAYGRPLDYLRNGRNGAEAYSSNYQGGEKLTRDARYEGRYEKGDRYKDDVRNKTYVIFDAEENRPPPFPRSPYLQDVNRYGYPAPPSVIPPTQVPFRQYPIPSPPAYPAYPNRNQYYPVAPPAPWGTNPRPLVGVTDPSYTARPYNSPDVQLPLSTSRSLPVSSAYDKLKKM